MKNPAVCFYRVGNYLHKRRLSWLADCVTWINRLVFSTYIPSTAQIGENFKVGYWGLGVVIHSKAIIGENCVVAQNVTIGRNFGDIKVPVIGNDVYVGAGSVIFGDITIGDNVIIGANSVVNKSVPPNCTVAGSPFKIIQSNRMEKYYELDLNARL